MIDFSVPKYGELPRCDDGELYTPQPYSFKDPAITGNDFLLKKLEELKNINPTAAVLSSVVSSVGPKDGSDTDTADETDENSVPEPLSSLFDPATINDDDETVLTKGKASYHEYRYSVSARQFENLVRVTNAQSSSPVWNIHRIGRITSSIAKQAFVCTDKNKTLLGKVMQYASPLSVGAVNYGKQHEPIARRCFRNLMSSTHKNLKVVETGLHVYASAPYIGASPDGIVTCDCHGRGILEVKCPLKYEAGLAGWEADKKFGVELNGRVKEDHEHYYQMQLQMLATGTKHGFYFVWTKGRKQTDKLVVFVEKDHSLCEKMLQKYKKLFLSLILPEIITRKNDPNNPKDRLLYCKCKRPSFPPMIACEGRNCKIEWYHYSCVNITRAPKGNWYCPDCRRQ